MKGILVFFPLRLGDSIFLTPLLKVLRRNYPDARIDAVTLSSVSKEVICNNPHINQAFHLPNGAMLASFNGKYDCFVDTFQSHVSIQYTQHLTMPRKGPLNYDESSAMSDLILEFSKKELGCEINDSDRVYQLFPGEKDFHRIQSLLRLTPHEKDSPLIGLHLGCHGLTKNGKWWRPWINHPKHRKAWPLKNFIKLAKLVQKNNPGVRFVLTGSSCEKKLAVSFMRKVPGTFDVIDQTSVLELAALMPSLTGLISSDTGVLHVGCAMQIPIVAIFGPTEIFRTGPYPAQPKFKVVSHSRMDKIKPKKVVESLDVLTPSTITPSEHKDHFQLVENNRP